MSTLRTGLRRDPMHTELSVQRPWDLCGYHSVAAPYHSTSSRGKSPMFRLQQSSLLAAVQLHRVWRWVLRTRLHE